jgi:hypothetical protein
MKMVGIARVCHERLHGEVCIFTSHAHRPEDGQPDLAEQELMS